MTKTVVSLLLASTLLGVAGNAMAKDFDFQSVEYMSADRRLPAAQAFIDRNAAPGAPMRRAVAAVERAGAACTPADPKTGVVTCKSDALRKRPSETVTDIVWSVQITPTPQGTVASATVQRRKAGGI